MMYTPPFPMPMTPLSAFGGDCMWYPTAFPPPNTPDSGFGQQQHNSSFSNLSSSAEGGGGSFGGSFGGGSSLVGSFGGLTVGMDGDAAGGGVGGRRLESVGSSEGGGKGSFKINDPACTTPPASCSTPTLPGSCYAHPPPTPNTPGGPGGLFLSPFAPYNEAIWCASAPAGLPHQQAQSALLSLPPPNLPGGEHFGPPPPMMPFYGGEFDFDFQGFRESRKMGGKNSECPAASKTCSGFRKPFSGGNNNSSSNSSNAIGKRPNNNNSSKFVFPSSFSSSAAGATAAAPGSNSCRARAFGKFWGDAAPGGGNKRYSHNTYNQDLGYASRNWYSSSNANAARGSKHNVCKKFNEGRKQQFLKEAAHSVGNCHVCPTHSPARSKHFYNKAVSAAGGGKFETASNPKSVESPSSDDPVEVKTDVPDDVTPVEEETSSGDPENKSAKADEEEDDSLVDA